MLSSYLAARAELDQRPLADEVELLQVFADLSELSRNRPAGEETKADTRVHSPREYFHTYLQSLDVDRAGAAGQLPQPAGPGARPLRRRRLRAHAGAGRGRVPDLPGPAAGLGRRLGDRHAPAAVADRAAARRTGCANWSARRWST